MSEYTPGPGSHLLPANWEELAKIREALGRIEATLGFVHEGQKLHSAKLETTDLRLYALEQGKIANAAAATAAQAVASDAMRLIEAYDISPGQFKSWKERVDEVVLAFKNNTLVVKVRSEMRKEVVVALSAICGFATGAAPIAFKYLGG